MLLRIRPLYGLALVALAAGLPGAQGATAVSTIKSGGDSVKITFSGIYATSPYKNLVLSDPLSTIANAFTTTFNDGSTVESYCVDLFHYTNPSHYTTVNTVNNASNFTASSKNTLNLSYSLAGLGRAAWLVNTYANQTDVNKAALQVAVWKAIYEEEENVSSMGSSLTTGSITFSDLSTSTKNKAIDYLTVSLNIGGNTYASDTGTWLSFAKSGNYTQDQIVAVSTPEPSALALSAIAMAGMAVSSYWRRRRAEEGDPS